MPLIVTKADFAKLRGVSKPAVLKAIKAGRIQTTDDGKIDVEQANAAWDANTRDPSPKTKSARKRQAHETPSAVDPAISTNRPPSLPPSMVLDFNEARTKKETFLAHLAEVEYQEKIGELIDARIAHDLWAKMLTEIKTRLLGVPSTAKSIRPDFNKQDMDLVDKLIRDALGDAAQCPLPNS